jgi:uroporphyrinogen decarboxylase
MKMNKKERVFRAIQLKPVDRIPTTFRASNFLSESLMNHFSIEEPNNFAKNHRAFLDQLKADFWSSGTKVDKFSTYIPGFNGPLPEPPYVDDRTFFYTIGIRAKSGNMGTYDIDYPVVGVDPPLAGVESHHDLKKGFLTSRLELYNFGKMQNKYSDVDVKDSRRDNDRVVCIGTLSNLFMICAYLRGMENFLADLAFNQKLVEHLVGEVGEFSLEFNRRELESIGDDAEYYGTWDDVAGQTGLMFSPVQFKKYFLPIYRKLIENNKKRSLYFGWHCCGSVHEVLPMMIDAGIDVFDVVQTSAKDMDLENVYRLYGKDVCLHGGLDVQKLLVEKTEKEIRQEIRKVKDLWGTRGGIILAPSHETLPDTPVENILAIYEELLEG